MQRTPLLVSQPPCRTDTFARTLRDELNPGRRRLSESLYIVASVGRFMHRPSLSERDTRRDEDDPQRVRFTLYRKKRSSFISDV
ncbi:hypothetical protein FKM82_019550 [Ascaphus truei]